LVVNADVVCLFAASAGSYGTILLCISNNFNGLAWSHPDYRRPYPRFAGRVHGLFQPMWGYGTSMWIRRIGAKAEVSLISGILAGGRKIVVFFHQYPDRGKITLIANLTSKINGLWC
jgi:hypothetical protein